MGTRERLTIRLDENHAPVAYLEGHIVGPYEELAILVWDEFASFGEILFVESGHLISRIPTPTFKRDMVIDQHLDELIACHRIDVHSVPSI